MVVVYHRGKEGDGTSRTEGWSRGEGTHLRVRSLPSLSHLEVGDYHGIPDEGKERTYELGSDPQTEYCGNLKPDSAGDSGHVSGTHHNGC